MRTIKRIRTWRRAAGFLEAIVVLGLPFIRIRGESAFRFDIPTLRLHFFGATLWMEDFFIVLIAAIFLSLLVILVTLLFGRVWCGWVCPQTVLADFTSFVNRILYKSLPQKFILYAAALVISGIVAANLIWYFISPYEFISQVLSLSPGRVTRWFWIVLTAIIFLDLILLRQTFCATVCPYARLQGTLFDNRTLMVAFDARRKDECIDCMACVKTCPVSIDVRQGINASCIHCAACIDSCTGVMDFRKKKSLIGYFFGIPGEPGRFFRLNALIIASVTAAFLVYFIYLVSAYMPVDMTVLPNNAFPARFTEKGKAVNSYILSVKNKGLSDAALKVKISGIRGDASVTPDRTLYINAGEMKKFPVYIRLVGSSGSGTKNMTIALVSETSGDEVVSEIVHFIIPEE